MVYFGRAVFLAVLLLPAAQAAAEEFNCQYVWTTGKKSGVGKDAMVQINGDKARWIFSVFKDVSQPKLGMRDEVWEYKVLENNDTGVVAGHAATNTAEGSAGMEVLVLNKTDGLLRLGQVRSDDVFSNIVARCDKK